MKKLRILALTVCVLTFIGALFAFSACSIIKPNDSNGDSGNTPIETGLSFNTFEVNGSLVYGKVSNATTTFDFANEITTKKDSKYVVSLDEFGIKTSLTGVVPLTAGDNKFYVFEMVNDEIKNTFLVTIRRRVIYTVSFNTNGGSSISSKQVEEDSYISNPSTQPERAGYNFKGWDYDFSTPITSSVQINAKWELINYSIEYDLNGGTLLENNPTVYNVESNFTLVSPTKEYDGKYQDIVGEYKFLGWYDGDTLVTTLNGKTGNKKLTAKWGSGYIYFGEYPQTIKANNVTITQTTNQKGYYLGSDGEWYAKVTATPYSSGYTFTNNTAITNGTVYYFKVEPIKWQILSQNNNVFSVVCASIIANKRYDDSSNNYANSEIRAWLNSEFYNTAYSDLQKQLIITTEVDNSVASTGFSSNQYACANTHDKVYLLSYKEAYAMDSTTTGSSEARERITSDYSRATGVYMYNSTNYYGNGYWWLRSPYYSTSDLARLVPCDGYIYSSSNVCNTYVGVVPALQIRLIEVSE